jgi:fatty acid/phospholipid biosynthesis enzyme
VGNILLKTAEGMGEVAMQVLQKGMATTEGAAHAALESAHAEIASGIDYAEAGAPRSSA